MDRELTCRLGRSAGRIAPCLVLAARWLAVAALIVGLTLAPTWPFDGAGAQAADVDLDVPGGGHFYTQTNGGAGMNGYAVTNSDGVPFWTFFNEVGGVSAVGYPVSHRFAKDGFVDQAFQKVIFQWRPEVGTVYYLNTLDLMHDAGLDPWLMSYRQTPPPSNWSSDAALPWDQVVARHQALLDQNPAIKAVYLAETDPLDHNGLPMAPPQDMGGVIVLRAQRKVYQQWLGDRPWARAGEVTVANGGDLAKEGGLLPPAAIVPQPVSSVPLGVVNSGVPMPTPTPAPPVPGPCQGDEQMTFTPNPLVGETVYASVTSSRALPNVGLIGEFGPQFQGQQTGGKGYVWSWAISPSRPGRFDYNFVATNGTVCTSNFMLVSGTAPTPTAAPATPTAAPASVCPSNFPVQLDPANPAPNAPFTITLIGPSHSFGLQAIVGEGVLSNEPPTTNPGTLIARVAGAPAGVIRYTYYINGLACQSIDVNVRRLLQ